jgi:hypothetical protein
MYGQKTLKPVKKALKKVINTYIHEKYTLIHVYANDTIIETTEEHPFWVEGKGWIGASELKNGDVLRLKSGKRAKVTQLKRVDLVKPVKVYNFEVEDWHTYFVSEEQVLVHNMCKIDLSNVNLSKWHKGGFDNEEQSFLKHYMKHKDEVGALSPEQYMRKAEEFARNLKGARKASISGYTPNVTRYYKNGRYIGMNQMKNIIW